MRNGLSTFIGVGHARRFKSFQVGKSAYVMLECTYISICNQVHVTFLRTKLKNSKFSTLVGFANLDNKWSSLRM